MSAWQSDCFKVFDESIREDGLSSSDGLQDCKVVS